MTVQTRRREMQRMATELEIKAVARNQLSHDGAQNVTLRGIARDMGMTAPALYRYFPSLDDLVVSMCEDFFEEVTEAISLAITQAPDSPGHGMHAATRTFRDWAVGHKGEFALMFRKGESPIAGGGAGIGTGRFAAVFFKLYVRMWHAHTFAVPELTEASAATCADLATFSAQCLTLPDAPPGESCTAPADLPPGALFVFARTWVRLYGVISMEVFGQLTLMFDDVAPYFESELEDAVAALGIPYVPRDA
ncbi:transcriptional regulator, TetR family [Sanguibacter gelidistatuariae]|uniref:Transcriptional regulator, TetR family n=1 Tax=Sanguibacter gelidistatuariae TaxID=1814289 RepID=A0A1G6W9Y7_9MICO|nr:TetR/AcrR family transcriptional regulator [Sanguibacter gelidistatuariae]SDD61866.1 transcriptional regulator, TetR family [Sanguibacter gelidistatuariae]